jgi:hypothetical protein
MQQVPSVHRVAGMPCTASCTVLQLGGAPHYAVLCCAMCLQESRAAIEDVAVMSRSQLLRRNKVRKQGAAEGCWCMHVKSAPVTASRRANHVVQR